MKMKPSINNALPERVKLVSVNKKIEDIIKVKLLVTHYKFIINMVLIQLLLA